MTATTQETNLLHIQHEADIPMKKGCRPSTRGSVITETSFGFQRIYDMQAHKHHIRSFHSRECMEKKEKKEGETRREKGNLKPEDSLKFLASTASKRSTNRSTLQNLFLSTFDQQQEDGTLTQSQDTSHFPSFQQLRAVRSIKGTARRGEHDILEVACIALEELWMVKVQPDILVGSSITLSHPALKLLRVIAAQLNVHDCLLLCCIKWEFNVNCNVDRSWAFYLGQGDQDLSSVVARYNKQIGELDTIEDASSHFERIKATCED
ncbi:hypothetical protein BKA65DRAFT_562002 [Rhexocercosporidium sp. MPI-PUGE-AT-0058]|nr:hypothetical protein BKA65DRAFT_562002 [Rhexocercosporidium sp. MPI-PUGE-AT-0058]